MEIDLKVVPNASRAEVVGFVDGLLKVRVMSPPEGGRANKEVCAVLAKALRVRPREVQLVAGEKSRTKRVRVTASVDEVEMRQRLAGGPERLG